MDNSNNNCIICGKKSIYNMTCRCSQWTCKKHRDPVKHNCTFDFLEHFNSQNKEKLPSIEAKKLTTI